MASPMIGLGFTNTYASNSDSSSSGSSTNPTLFTGTMNGSGLYDITIANADTYSFLGAEFNSTVSTLCKVERYSEGTTTAIRLRGTDPVEAANKVIAGSYILTANI